MSRDRGTDIMTDDDLLDLLHRERLHDVDALASRAQCDRAEVSAALERMTRAGHLSVQDGVILLNAPAHAAALAIERLLESERAQAGARSAQLAAIVEGVARRTSSWNFGEAVAQDQLALQHAEGPHAEDLWFAVQAGRLGPGGRVRAVLTDLDRYRQSSPERTRAFAQVMSSYTSVQAIIPAMDLDEQLLAMLRTFRDAAVEFRMLPDPPSWFWVDDEDVTGLPMERYGVATLFALGAAWAEDGSPGAHPPNR